MSEDFDDFIAAEAKLGRQMNGLSPRDYSDKPLSPEEVQQIRRILAADNAWRWFASAARNIALWITVVIGAIIAWKTLSKP